MTFPIAGTIPWRRAKPGGLDAHSNPAVEFETPIPFSYIGISPRSDGQTEPRMAGRDAVIIGLTVLAPPSPKPSPHDRFLIDGEEFEVDGEIGDWTRGPYGFQPGISFALRRAEG